MPPELAEAPAAPAVRALTCPSCGGTVTLRAAGYTVTVACLYCGSILDVADPQVKLVTEYKRQAAELEIPLGTRGTLRGVEWEAVGYLRRSMRGAYPWSEYLLFNPYQGYRWLITDGRGWSFGTMLTDTPSDLAGGLSYAGQAFEPFFAKGQAQVDYVLGEFYWRVAAGEEVETADWVRPHFMLSREANAQEVSWTLAELLSPREIGDAFGVESPRNPWPPLPHQVSPYAGEAKWIAMIGAGISVFLILLYFVMGSAPKLTDAALPFTIGAGERTATVGPVTLTRPWQLVSIRASAPGLDNSWLDLDYALVDRKTQTSYEAYGAAERYSGRDSDGAWSEGSGSTTVKIAAVPAGTYDLVVDYNGTRWSSASSISGSSFGAPEVPQQVELTVRSGAFFGSNLLLALVLILVPLIWLIARHAKFEHARQAESDFGPSGLAKIFTSGDDEDD